jgi:hypothetical protein
MARTSVKPLRKAPAPGPEILKIDGDRKEAM